MRSQIARVSSPQSESKEVFRTMKRSISTAAVCCLAFALCAQTPSPAPQLSKSLRHLEYDYAVDYQHLGGSDTGEISTTAGAGTVSYSHGTGRQGKLFVDVMGVAQDGGLVIQVAEWPQTEPRLQQEFTCAVYPDTRVICPPQLPVTDAETTILGFLGRNFVDPTLIDANNHWERKVNGDFATIKADFTVASTTGDGKLATIEGHSEIRSTNGANRNWDDNSKIVYDLTMEVPTSVHDVSVEGARGNHSYQSTMDFTLKSDSLAKTQP
jgi:hypothetical protein